MSTPALPKIKKRYDPRGKPYQAQLTAALTAMRAGDFETTLVHCANIESQHGQTPWTQMLAMLIVKDRIGDKASALEGAQAIIERWPGWADAQYNYGAFLQEMGRWQEAIRPLKKTLVLDPTHHAAKVQLGTAYIALGDIETANRYWDDVLSQPPKDAREAYQRCAIYAARNDFDTFWDLQELRWIAQDNYQYDHGAQPSVIANGELWTGDSLKGHTLLILDEQGAGDFIQFARYLPIVAAEADQVWLRLKQPSLASLVRAIAPSVQIINHIEPQPLCSRFVGMLSLYHRLVLRRRSIGWAADERPIAPFPQNYITPSLTAALSVYRPVVGLCWAGSTSHPRDAQRSIPFEQIAPLIEAFPRIRFINACYDPRGDVTHDLMLPRWAAKDYLSTCTMLAGIDLLITVDTSIAHLAGAMGVPTWVLVTTLPDMRWGLMNDTTPWYRSWVILRQKEPNNWPRLINAMIETRYRNLHTWTST